MIRTKSEDAVSPVIGVMLMLVVTIVIAAVVAVFASGVGMDSEPAPATAVDVVGISAWEYSHMGFSYMPSGTGFSTKSVDGSTIFYDTNTGEEFLKLTSGVWTVLGTNTTLLEMHTIKLDKGYGDVYAPSVTITSLHGESLDLSKVSVKVYYHHNYLEDGVIEQEKPLSGTLNPGDKVTIPLSAEMVNHQYPLQSSTVDVIVYYGSHKIAEAEKLVVS